MHPIVLEPNCLSETGKIDASSVYIHVYMCKFLYTIISLKKYLYKFRTGKLRQLIAVAHDNDYYNDFLIKSLTNVLLTFTVQET